MKTRCTRTMKPAQCSFQTRAPPRVYISQAHKAVAMWWRGWVRGCAAATARPRSSRRCVRHATAQAPCLWRTSSMRVKRVARSTMSVAPSQNSAPRRSTRSSLLWGFKKKKQRLQKSSPHPCGGTKGYLESNVNRARFWLRAGNYIEPEGEIRNRVYFHARDSDLP